MNDPATVKSSVAADTCQTHVVFIGDHFIVCVLKRAWEKEKHVKHL